MADKFKPLIWPAVIILVVAVLDQFTKAWAVEHLTGQPSMSVLGDFFRFTLVYNTGGAMGTNIGTPAYYLLIAVVIVPVLGYFLYRYRNLAAFALPLAFICGGALGNIIDRIRLGKVVDFLDVDFFNIHIGSFDLDRWWTFNIADSAITCALVFMIIRLLFFSPVEQRETKIDSTTSVPAE